MTGLRALYFYYLYRMGALPKKRKPNPRQVYFLFREDIRFIQKISRETRLLVEYKIDTTKQLTSHKSGLAAQINVLYDARKRLRNRKRSVSDDSKLTEIKSEIAALSSEIGGVRRELRLCEDIENRSLEIRDKLHRARDHEQQVKSKTKGVREHEQFRGRRRTDSPDEFGRR